MTAISTRCEMEACRKVAVATVHAQWTIVDFVDYEMCEEHVREAASILERRTVDGLAAQDVWFTYYG